MANTKSAIKNMRKSARLTDHNRKVKSRLRTLARNITRMEKSGASEEEKKAAAVKYVSALDKAAKTNVIHSNIADRRKAAYSKYIFGKDGAPKTQAAPVAEEEKSEEEQ